MKKRTAASTILISLAAVTGCNSSDGDYVAYKQTTPSEFEEHQKLPTAPANDDAKADTPAVDLTEVTPQDVVSPEVGGIAARSSDDNTVDDNTVKPASHSMTGENSVPEKSSTEIKSIVSTQSGLTGRADTPEIDNAPATSANKIELLIPEKSFRRERGTEAVRISYDDIDLLKILNMEPVPANAAEYFPEWLSALNGKQIRIRGWMYPTFVSEGLTSFTLARDNGICCFQRMPKIYDVIFVKLEEGQSSRYIDQRPFDVEGTFRIDNESDGSELPRLYKIENARVLD
ncbi:MAG: hypothetical protein H7Z17_04290 [Fuerstia sp.]|nr:hypothetical protein [Fuerstiella sp.]